MGEGVNSHGDGFACLEEDRCTRASPTSVIQFMVKTERFICRNTPVDRAGTALLDCVFPLGVRDSFDQCSRQGGPNPDGEKNGK